MNYLIAQEDIEIKGNEILKGSKYTLNSEGYLHSFNDLPALIYSDGSQYWYLNGVPHRKDGPAVIESDGYQSWWLNGKRHRIDEPAVIESDGSQSWYLKGKLHRIDGPAIIESDGSQSWYLKGKQVRPIKVLKIMKAKGLNLTHFTLDKDKKIREAIKELL